MAPPQPSSAASTSVQVALRIRPTTQHDLASIPTRFQRNAINAASNTTVSVDTTPSPGPGAPTAPASSSANNAKKQMFTFDQVHPPATTQHAMFTSTAQPLISRFTEGYNCTILAYGQTSSGKTFTMTGIDLDADPTDPNNGMGIIPRSISMIFTRCRELKEQRGGTWNYSIKGSYIELYNEDLIDLLADGTAGKRDVQIREDKQGHIIWEGLREVNVKNANDVMNLIRQGASIRRTNETDMNAQSSRSHAIFSLTLTQKKFTGSGLPPRSSSPLPPNGRSPSRIARPGSVIGAAGGSRVSSPTFGRPGTPSFQSAIARGGRPASSLGFLSPDAGRNGAKEGGEDRGDWVTVTSKFHFVDLAGSERLKRTAAAGERVKEGISINSGLLALGNVISALGDPAKAKTHTASYIPYRDSKLTRLLQDSLGGNAHTLMIACVSPAEWNVNETINTLKYANRARNIKNRAVLNEKEEGWDDVEWLQGMVTRLRKEVKQIKEGGGGPGAVASSSSSDSTEAAPKRVLAQMTELQNNYEDLREKYVERTEELTRLRNELADRHRNSTGGRLGGTAKYEEIVGPVIEEYEKTISAIEAELKLNRAALRHTNDLYDEKENEYTALEERHSTTELYVEELKARVAKLSEREASTEAYVHDLEEKVRQYDESQMSSSGSITDLKRELARYKDTESHSSSYISDLETRLAKSDESVLSLRDTVEKLERECEKRRDQVLALESRLEGLKQDGENWRSDLELREAKVRELEQKMEEWEAKKRAASEERERLGELASEVVKAKKELEGASPTKTNGATTNGTTTNGANSEVSSLHEADGSLETQLVGLQQTHTATLADLSSVTAKYRDALREIADLAAQLQEAKVNAPVPIPESPEHGDGSPRRRMSRLRDQEPSNGSARRLFFRNAASSDSLHSRSLSQSVSLSQELSSARSRKASTSSHGTSSSISQSPGHSRPNLSLSLPSVSISPTERSVASLEEEIMRLQDVIKERETEISALETTLKEKDQTNTITQPAVKRDVPELNGEALVYLSPQTITQFSEIRKSLDLHYVNHDTTSDVDESLERLNELMRSMAQKESSHKAAVDALTAQLNQVRKQHEDLQVLSRDQALNMSTELEALRKKHEEDLANHDQHITEMEALQARQTKLTQTVEESQRHEAELQTALNNLKDREAKLVESLKQVEETHASEVQQLKTAHEEALRTKEADLDVLVAKLKEEHAFSLSDLHAQVAESSSALERAQREHEEAFGKLKAEHEEELRHRLDEAAELLERTHSEHDVATSDHEGAINVLKTEHAAALGKLASDHLEEVGRHAQEAEETLQKVKVEHADALATATAEHQESMKNVEEQHAAHLSRTEEEYYNALTKLRADHAQSLEKQAAEAATAMERLKDEHTRELRMAEIARQGSLSESKSARDVALLALQEEQASAIKNKEQQFSEDMQRLKDEHSQALAAKLDQHRESLQRLKADHSQTLANKELQFSDEVERLHAEHSRALADKDKEQQTVIEKLVEEHSAAVTKVKEESTQEIARLTAALEESKAERAISEAALRAEIEQAMDGQKTAEEQQTTSQTQHDEVVKALKDEHAAALADLQRTHVEELELLTESHRSTLSSFSSDSEDQRTSLVKEHAEEVARLKAEHQTTLIEAQAVLVAAQERHRSELEDARSHGQELRTSDKEHLKTTLTEMEKTHAAERETLLRNHNTLLEDLRKKHAEELENLSKEHNNLLDELDTHKAASDEWAHAREEMRQAHESAIQQKTASITVLETELSTVHGEREEFAAEVDKLRAELQRTRDETSALVKEASKRQSLVDELERHRSVIAEMQDNLQRTKDEMDTLTAEKSRQDALLRDLQQQLGSPASPTRPPTERTVSYTRATGMMSPGKLPPPTPPPTVPIPPAPRIIHEQNSSSSTIISLRSISVDGESPSTPATSVNHSVAGGLPSPLAGPRESDPKVAAQLAQQSKHIEEQEAMIKTLNKQLTHCETDLQAHMDMVATLEASLGDSEKNLRKARMQATELARERDNVNSQLTNLRAELADAKAEVVNVRRSIVEEKQSLESRLDEERRAKERARAQLDSRMEDVQRRKSKFACL